KKLKKQIVEIENSIKNDIKIDKIEIVFMPYKASMWDSFESVWVAARDDPQCDVIVVPIPYYNKNSDGSFGEMVYEGDLYPKNITVADWQKYDIESRRPDVIFFHNPYDNRNYVTSVHPDFYSERLKKFSDMLVFIDYGLPYLIPKKPRENCVISQGHLSCDVYVTHSKEYTEQINHLLKKYINTGGANQKRAVTLGSAKIDKVINTKKEDYDLPIKWQKIIGERKILLLSTSLEDVLKGKEFYLECLRNLETFKNREDIVIWWRPHPLSDVTYKSMQPHLLNDYLEVVENYKLAGYGIFDDTSDLHRAIAWSDAFYTGESSLLLLYLATGKPFVSQSYAYWPEKLIEDDSVDFTPILKKRIQNMQTERKPNVIGEEWIINWHNFNDKDYIDKFQYTNFIERFIHFIVNEDEYPDANLYRMLKQEMLQNAVENADGTAGAKIYAFVKKKALGAV
ncbi:MAG: hypothetical protein FWH17_10310, partial [Oscillospiraceae bacterium]|nr:hypothetical protein [Oscillospiraceae bacterium]